MRRAALLSIGCALAGCSSTTEPDPEPEPQACDGSFSDAFTIGAVEIDQTGRSYVPYARECNAVEVISGFQGGWHIEPAIGGPSGVDSDDLAGTFVFEVIDSDQNVITEDAVYQMEPRFWQPTSGGLVYWGDTIVFNGYPELGMVTLRATVTLREAEDEVVEAMIELIDDEDDGG